ncbi:hypothetical protein [Ochrobactrum sp. SFR4]|uniref:hypothetical protein n=1 Tax=Ochrobactrum sp. SFR4 TaxID=2717368 RepID=UPI001C8BCF87|nr:hypothetical protein [Ochrobactrum sp. SFR4]MBX8825283.1 hypothetical protein [Ochrobactrum sp. SFR4]
MTRDELLIEAAKLINPHPFKSYDDLKSYCLSKGDTESAAYECAEGMHGRDCSELINTAGKICDLLFHALKEPTEEMMKAIGATSVQRRVWQSMLAASPLAPEGGRV